MAHHLITHNRDRSSDKAGWHERQILNEKKIAELENPDEQSGDQPVRSIPSPFAPMHLAKEAMLQYVDLNGQVSPDTKHVISDALDVGVLFFELAERSHLIDALYFSWESTDPKSASYQGSARLNAALRLFRKEDGDQYGLNSTSQLHLLTLKHEPHRVFGGTCPETMFFAAPGDKPWGRDVDHRGRRAFRPQTRPAARARRRLHPVVLRVCSPSCATTTSSTRPSVATSSTCASRSWGATNRKLAREIAARLTEPDGEYYHKQFRPVTDGAGHDIVLAKAVSLRGQKAELDDDLPSSFHMLVEEGRRHKRMPLAMPQSATGASTYTVLPGEAYNRDKHRPPHRATEALEDRTLPGLGTKKYPYLTTDDFLEPTLMRLPYPLDAKFWLSVKHPDGVSSGAEVHDYLLPLKPMFFKYFSAASLLSPEKGTPSFSVSKSEEAYTEFTLDIPLANGGTASFSRKYYPRAAVTQDGSTGVRLNVSFGLAMFPSYVDRERPEHQRLMLNTKLSDSVTSPSSLALFDSEGASVAAVEPYSVDWSSRDRYRTYTYQPRSRFDAIEMSTALPGERGVLIPKRRARRGSEKMVFSVDFGTTNTHIEVSRQASMRGPLGSPGPEGYTALTHPLVEDGSGGAYVGPIDRAFLINNGMITYQSQPEDLFPTRVGPQERVRFPIRTASVENGDAINQPSVATHTIAIPWGYPLRNYPTYTVSTNLKWSTRATQERTQKRAEAFIDTLCMMMRAYVLENQGALDQVELVWFFPTSMMRFETDKLTQTWNEAFKKYFSDDAAAKVRSLPESLAPFYAWRKEDNINIEARPTVIADIGGGTCDITVFQAERGETKVRRVSSYKFAGNTIFGDGKGVTERNGFVRAFVNKVAEAKGQYAEPAAFGAGQPGQPGREGRAGAVSGQPTVDRADQLLV